MDDRVFLGNHRFADPIAEIYANHGLSPVYGDLRRAAPVFGSFLSEGHKIHQDFSCQMTSPPVKDQSLSFFPVLSDTLFNIICFCKGKLFPAIIIIQIIVTDRHFPYKGLMVAKDPLIGTAEIIIPNKVIFA